jgi:REP element-mobilizing transposase RayT
MRRARITYKGAYHHVINRGHEGKKIFFDDSSKYYFLESIKNKSKKLKIEIFCYCIMPTHYHLILQNSSGKLSEFMKQLNGQYGMYYRKRMGGLGHVFQGRFKSTLIGGDTYMRMATVYVLLNPVRAGMVKDPWEYEWSSINEYYTRNESEIVNNQFIEYLFQSKGNIGVVLRDWMGKELPLKKSRMGDILGDDGFIKEAKIKFNRRKSQKESHNRRIKDYSFKRCEEVIGEFEKINNINLDEMNLSTYEGKRLRGKLLVELKDKAGLTYKEINELPVFKNIKYFSLGQLYKRALKRINTDNY